MRRGELLAVVCSGFYLAARIFGVSSSASGTLPPGPVPLGSTVVQEVKGVSAGHEALVRNWLDVMTLPDSLRLVVDRDTIEPLDTIMNARPAIRRYFSHVPFQKRREETTISGRAARMQDAFDRYERFETILRAPFLARGLPVVLSYLPVVESYISPDAVSWAHAVGAWQITRGAAGDLVINRRIDERRSLVASTGRAAEILDADYHLFPDPALTATSYIRGAFGVAADLEDMLGLDRQGRLFSGYSGMVMFAAQNDEHVDSLESFAARYRRYDPVRFAAEVKSMTKYRSLADPRSLAAIALYTDYLTDAKGITLPSLDTAFVEGRQDGYLDAVASALGGSLPVGENLLPAPATDIVAQFSALAASFARRSPYLRSFFDYYGLSDEGMALYWQYHDYLQGTENSFSTPQYVPELLAVAELFAHPGRYGLKDPDTSPVKVESLTLQRAERLEDVIDPDDPLVEMLNGHIRRYAARTLLPEGTTVYLPQ